MKIYMEIPFLERYRGIDHIPLYAGLSVSWSKHDFEICDNKTLFPRGIKKGKHIFRLTFGIMYLSIAFIIYKPKN